MSHKSVLQIVLLLAMIVLGISTPAEAEWGDALVYKTRDISDPNAGTVTESIVLHDLSTGVRQTVATYTNSVDVGTGFANFPVVVSSDGRLAFTTFDASYVWNEGELMELPYGREHQWNEDGRLAFIVRNENERDIFIWDDGELTGLGLSDYNIADFDWNSDGRFVFSVWDSPALYIWDEGTITDINPTPDEGQVWVQALAWSEDGRIAFVAGQNGGWYAYVWAEGTITQIGRGFSYLEWNSDGHLAYSDAFSLFVWDGENSEEIGAGIYPQWSVDGRLAFYSNRSSELHVWDGHILINVGDVTEFYSPAWNSDGRLVFSDNDLHIWDDGEITQITDTPDIAELDPQWMP
jgi:hypothetical protein